jgi:hypothetical protein
MTDEEKVERRVYLRLYRDRSNKRYKVTRTIGTDAVEPGDWLTVDARKALMARPGIKVITDEGK